MLDAIKKIVVVVGCQRSGTTLTGQIVGSHPKAFLLDETDGVYEWFKEVSGDGEVNVDTLYSVLLRAHDKYVQKRGIVGHLRENADCGSATTEITHLVLKVPNLTYEFERLSTLDIPVAAIYLVRDPRSVVRSMTRLSQIPMVENQIKLISAKPDLVSRFAVAYSKICSSNTSEHVKRALVWLIKSSLVGDFLNAGIPTMVLKYEDLVLRREEMAQLLAEHCSLNFSQSMLQHHSILTGKGPGGTERSRPIDSNSLDAWVDLDPLVLSDIKCTAKELMSEYGYT
ncbi:sulfotransferase [Arenicella xantha]|uniref:Sulfotransferase family protein n=1 Tax=Arenicella xantha TaxID=644221 RepID=A0A395JKC2_9GAMM|nr:sulfotransferase [Arenicella xantha]RBP50989.1 sulfotransferase family protein [Arenicella xantha]